MTSDSNSKNGSSSDSNFSTAENSFHEENEEVGGEESDVSSGSDGWSDVNEENISEEVVRDIGSLSDSDCNVEGVFMSRDFKLGDDGRSFFIGPCKRGLCLRGLRMREEELLVVVGQRAVLGECMVVQLKIGIFGQILSLGGSTFTAPSITGPPQKIKRLETCSTSAQPSNIRPPPIRRMEYPSTQNQSPSEATCGSSKHTNQPNDAFASQPLTLNALHTSQLFIGNILHTS
ncbi:hypothetical protein ACOSP7_030884 [Xanthoceras sorbifolium]